MKETKRTIRYFKFYNRKGMQAYLEEMAAKGWLLTKVTELFWQFRRIEPAKLHFSVVYFPQASIYDAEASEKQEQFHELCEHTGWKLAASDAQLQFFYNDADSPVPIETDAVFEVENIHKAVKKRFLPGYYGELFLSLLNSVLLVKQGLENPIAFLSSGGSLLYLLCWILVAILSLTELTGYARWYKKAKRSAEAENRFAEPNSHPEHMFFIVPILLLGIGVYVADKVESTSAVASAFAVAGGTLFIALFAVFLFFGTMHLLKKGKAPAGVTRVIAPLVCGLGCLILFVFFITGSLINSSTQRTKENLSTYEYNGHTLYEYQDTLPFTLSDLIHTDYTFYSRTCRTKASFLLSDTDASERPRLDAFSEPRLDYRILQVKTPFLYDYCLDTLLKELAHNFATPDPEIADWVQTLSIPAAPWGANEAYRLSLGDKPQNRYLLCYDNAIVELDLNWEPDDAAIGNIKHSLTSVLSESLN